MSRGLAHGYYCTSSHYLINQRIMKKLGNYLTFNLSRTRSACPPIGGNPCLPASGYQSDALIAIFKSLIYEIPDEFPAMKGF